MKKLLMMAVMALALAPCFSDTLTIPDGNGGTKTLGEDEEDLYPSNFYKLADANNDGYLDIVEGIPAYSGSGGDYYELHIYNPTKRAFEKGEIYTNLEIKGDGTISTSGYENRIGSSGGSSILKWNGKEFKTIESKFYYYSTINCDYPKYSGHIKYDITTGRIIEEKYYKDDGKHTVECTKAEYESHRR